MKKKSLLGKDSLVILFTKDEGKVVAVAKGVKKLTSRRSPHLQTGNLILVKLHKKGDRVYLEGSDLISGFTELKKNQKKVNILYQFFFVLERLLPEQQKEEKAYSLTKKFLINLSEAAETNTLILFDYLNKLMKLLGYLKAEKDASELSSFIEEIINEKLPASFV